MNQEKLMIFIDGSNLFHSAETYGRVHLGEEEFRVDVQKLIEKLKGDDKLIRAYYFGSTDAKSRQQIDFHSKLSYSGIRTVIKPLKRRYDTRLRKSIAREKGVDVALATELLSMGYKKAFTRAIVVSGDQDYATAIRYVQDQGLRVEVASFNLSLAIDLKKIADGIIIIDSFAKEIKLQRETG